MASRMDGRVPMHTDVYEKKSGVSISFLRLSWPDNAIKISLSENVECGGTNPDSSLGYNPLHLGCSPDFFFFFKSRNQHPAGGINGFLVG